MDFCGSSGIVAFVVSSCKSAPARNDAAAGEAAKNDVDGTVASMLMTPYCWPRMSQ